MSHDHQHHLHGHSHGESTHKNIVVAFWLNTGFAVLELAGGFLTNSVAILSDALHDFGDSLSLGLAYYFHKKSARKRDDSFSYGYKRFSLLGAFVNSLVLIIGSIFILQESIRRLLKPEQADARGMLILAVLGVSVNLIAMLRLRSGSTLNERVVSLHFLEDVLGWVAVLIGSVVMLFANVPILDPLLSLLIAGYILFNVFRNLRQAFKIILQGIPENVNLEEIQLKIKSIPGIQGVHDLHSWTLDGQYNVMTIHLVMGKDITIPAMEEIKRKVRHDLQHLNIQHLTVEAEWEGESCELTDC